ncbi:DNA topoisomerase IV subunit A [Mycoplasmatota bacterium]|nr:DNA topoisomerase IV subunit A [Mycoplasmatota bacterium]
MEEINKIIDENIESVLSDRFARYSKYIIQERALPDVRDGLKPVQRRILYSMYKEKNLSNKPYRKSAKTVGNVIGNYHPHGDSSVYEAMVRLSQDWKMRERLVDMHGNNGSIDNDPPAAMRYTEARLSKIAEELTRDIDKYTVDFALNFDDTDSEPTVLPSRFPNILVNGSQGISAGYATEIPPHNLDEVISGTIYRLKHPLCSLEEIMNIIGGPDFPTGGIVQGIDGIKTAYETGRGKIVVRCKYYFAEKKNQIIITEIPYEVNKANLLKKIEDIRLNKKLDGLDECRDESDKDGLRIVIDCKKEANREFIIKYLLKNTNLKVNYNFNMVMIHNKHPKQLGLLNILDAYIEHQKEVVINRSNYELSKSRKRLHILEGLIKMVSILDQVIYTIRHSKNKVNAKENIIEQFDFSDEQAEAIVTLQLYRLTTTDIETLEEEARHLTSYINELLEILNFENKLVKVIISELKQIQKLYANPRMTEIQNEVEDIHIDQTKMIKSEDVVLNITKQGYIRTFKCKTNEMTIKNASITAKDYIIANLLVNTLDKVLLFTNKGNYIFLHVHQIDIIKNTDFKQHINDLIRIDPDEHIVKVIVVKEFRKNQYIVLATKQGFIKRSPLSEFETTRNNKSFTSISFKHDDDELVNAYLSDNKNREVVIVTKFGYLNKYNEDQIPVNKLKAAGVKSINLKTDDEVVSFNYIYNNHYELILLTNRGNIKKIKQQEISFSVRTNRGSMTLKPLKKNSHQYIGSAFLKKDEPFVVEKDGSYLTFVNHLNSYSEIISNGKLFEEFKGKVQLSNLVEITTNLTNVFSDKLIKKEQISNKIDKKEYEQLELFKN